MAADFYFSATAAANSLVAKSASNSSPVILPANAVILDILVDAAGTGGTNPTFDMGYRLYTSGTDSPTALINEGDADAGKQVFSWAAGTAGASFGTAMSSSEMVYITGSAGASAATGGNVSGRILYYVPVPPPPSAIPVPPTPISAALAEVIAGLDTVSATQTRLVTLDSTYTNPLGVLSNGDLSYEWNNIGSFGCSYSTLPQSTGKYYFEVVNTQPGGFGGTIYDNWSFNGGISTDRGIGNDVLIGTTATAWGFSNTNSSGVSTDSRLFNSSTPIELVGTPQIPLNGYLGVAVDFDAGKIWFNANGTWVLSGNPAAGTNPAYTFTPNIIAYAGVGQGSRSPFGKSTINFGATAFAGTVPSGFVAWNVVS